MRKKSFMSFCSVAIAIIIIAMLLGACTQPAPTPAPTPGPTPAPKPTPTEPVSIQILASGAGGSAHTAMFAVADILTKNDPSVKAEAIETLGTMDNFKLWQAMSTDEKKTTLLNADSGSYNAAQIPGLLTIGRLTTVALAFATFDKNINTVDDLAGKKIVIGQQGGGLAKDMEEILKMAGVLDKVDGVYMKYADGAQALVDGLVVAAPVPFNFDLAGTMIQAQPFMQEVYAKSGVRTVGISDAVVEKMKQGGTRLGFYQVPTGLLPNQPQPIYLSTNDSCVIRCGDVCDETLIYGITKTVAENANKLVDYSKGLVQATAEGLPWLILTEKDFHPGALKYYKEKGYKIGR